MADLFVKARKRQIARLNGEKPQSASAALAFAKSREYQDSADAEATLRAYKADLTGRLIALLIKGAVDGKSSRTYELEAQISTRPYELLRRIRDDRLKSLTERIGKYQSGSATPVFPAIDQTLQRLELFEHFYLTSSAANGSK